MKKKYHKTIIGFYALIVLAAVIWHAGGVSAQDTIKLTVNSHLTSTAAMDNMQPGDTRTSGYTMINDGNQPFDYAVDFEFLSGDAELYNILQMTLQKEGVIIYSGVMSEAAGRISIGTLEGRAQEAIQMEVLFPPEAGNEYQGKKVSVAFNFSASAKPGPSSEPTPAVTPGATAAPAETPAATASPTVSAAPVTASSSDPAATVSPAPSAEAVTVSEAPVPLGGDDGGTSSSPTATPDAGAATVDRTPAPPSPDDGIPVNDDALPLAAPDAADKLPDTAEPWYNLIAASIAVAILSLIAIRKLGSKK